jgi:hypothetical protein
MKKLNFLAIFFGVSLVACGGGDGDSSETPLTPKPSQAAAQPLAAISDGTGSAARFHFPLFSRRTYALTR